MKWLLDNDQKRFNDYEYYLQVFEQHKLALSCYKELDEVLKAFRKRLEDITASYYIKLSQVMDTLIQSFRENRDALASEKILQADSWFSHLAVEVPAEGASNEWLEPVDDEAYGKL